MKAKQERIFGLRNLKFKSNKLFILLLIFFLFSSMSSYLNLSSDNYSGSINNMNCSNCHSLDATALGISYWELSGPCYIPGFFYGIGIQLRDSSQLASHMGIQLATKNSSLSGRNNPVVSSFVTPLSGNLIRTVVNGIEVYTHESPQSLSMVQTFPNNILEYGNNIAVQYLTDSAASDTIYLYLSSVFTILDSTVAMDRVISDSVKIPPCTLTDIKLLRQKTSIHNIIIEPECNIIGQKDINNDFPFRIKYNRETSKFKKIVIIP